LAARDIVVFLGPTLRRDEATAILEATYLPPAEQGSVFRACRVYRPMALVLIDGAFGSVPAVRHKEILWACANGFSVFGASSIGAIRAAELAAVGMQGYGLIYRWYARTLLADDDEVAVAMTPPQLGAEPLSEALINMRQTLRRAQRERVLTREQRLSLEEIARATAFVDRTYANLLEQAHRTLPANWSDVLTTFERWLPGKAIDQKRSDAVGLLTRLAKEPHLEMPQRLRPPFRLTEAWAHDLADDGLWDDRIVNAADAKTEW
jgi:hypothetical protein